MSELAFAEMLQLARESRGLTQKHLAEAANISQGNISKYETGQLRISSEHLERIAEVLGYPVTFFMLAEKSYSFASTCTYHRKRKTLSAFELRTLDARFNILSIHVDRLLSKANIECERDFPQLKIEASPIQVEDIAKGVRLDWGIGLDPIDNLVDLIESAGGLVYRASFGTRKLDAISQWVNGMSPVFFLNADMPGERQRFSLAHELGHILMHRNLSNDIEENEEQADRFASEFLMPAEAISADLSSLNLPKLAKLKAYWRVSMAALIRRAYDLKKITHRQYRSLFEQLGKMGYRINEPVPIPSEHPTIIKEIIDVCRDDGYSDSEISSLLALYEHEFRSMYSFEQPRLRVVD